MSGLLLWKSRALPAETATDAAERFVREVFDTDRTIRWCSEPGEFCFADGYWTYRIAFEFGEWCVHRTDNLTRKAKARRRARSE